MKITFIGAAHEVTGSCTLVEAGGARILVDCGMEQGADIFENQSIPVSPNSIDCVLLTHAHIDHSGNLPLLYRNGYRGLVYASEASCNLCNIMLLDSAHIQSQEAEWRNRKAKRGGGKEYEPVYDVSDALGIISKLRPCAYNCDIRLTDGVSVCFRHVGHLLGAASIELTLHEGDECRRLVFSGDVGNRYQPVINDEKKVTSADYVVLESTYGDRLHAGAPDYINELASHLQRALDRNGNVVIPSFAVGRTQEILYYIRQIKLGGMINGHPDFPVYVDSPLAIEATNVFLQCDEDDLDEPTRELIRGGINPLHFGDLNIATDSEQSKAINADPRPKVIISASGMCEAGRIRHHLKHNLWRKESLILFVGYQAAGTLGRALLEGAEKVKLFGEEIAVNAEIALLAGVSGHADRDGLCDWLGGFEEKPKKVFINHGEDEVCEGFAGYLREKYGYATFAPYSGTCFDLLSGELLEEAAPVLAQPKKKRESTAFSRLVAAGERLMSLIRASEGAPNKELSKLTGQIVSVCDKWESRR